MAEKTVKKKPNILGRMGRTVVRFFRDTKSEMKRVVWPGRKQVLNNFVVVMVFVVLCALFIFALDLLFNWILGLILDLSAKLGA